MEPRVPDRFTTSLAGGPETPLWLDTWVPDYGASSEMLGATDVEEEELFETFEQAEGDEWRPIRPPALAELPCCAFVDGVRRVDARLFAGIEGEAVPALAGSWAVGAAWANPSMLDHITVGRALVVGGGMTHADLTLPVGGMELRFVYEGVAGDSPADTLLGLQNQMRTAEAELAMRVLALGKAELVVQDGPLTYFADPKGPLVGLIKRQSRTYLPPEQQPILGMLAAGERTPLFVLGGHKLSRVSWYTRIADRRSVDGPLTGLVRLEVSARAVAEDATRLADLTTAILPRFASVVGRDPRAPQNLYPVGQLERTLRHRLGDPELVRRAIQRAIWRQDAA